MTMTSDVLFVVPNVPYPLISGGHHRDWQIMNLLARMRSKPHLLYFGAGEGRALSTGGPVDGLCASVTFGGPRVEAPDSTRIRTLRRKLGYLTGLGEPSFPFSHQYDAMDAGDRILKTARAVGAEVVVLRAFLSHHAPALKASGFKVIANCPDYNTQLAWEMIRSVRGPLRKFGPLCNYFGVRRQERKFLPICDEVWVPTENEARMLAGTVARERLLLMPNLLDVAAYPDCSLEEGDGSSLLFVANYEYPPNANAARLLLTEIFPAVKARVATARLVMVGRGLSSDLIRLAESTPGIELAGFVDDLSSCYRRTAVVLLPVREGAGMLFKTLEALSFGKAAVGFAQSFRGLGGNGNRPFIPVRSTAEFIERTVALLEDEAARRTLAQGTRDYARSEISWERGLQILQGSLLKS